MSASTSTSTSTSSGEEDLVTRLVREHREVEGQFLALEMLFGHGTEEVADAVRQVVADLMRHSVAEEVHLYPTVRERLPDGDRLADREIAEHDETERTMKLLESLDPRGSDFWITFKILTNLVRQHVGEEEHTLLPALRERCSAEELQDLGRKVAQVERTAPTRPHPSAPSEGSTLEVLAPGAGLVDRLRDAFSSPASGGRRR